MARVPLQAASNGAAWSWSDGVRRRRVGGENGWVVGVVNYTLWASLHTFLVGDFLEFNYLQEFHNVLEVTEESYARCSASNPINLYMNGKTIIQLKEPKTYYFICGVMNHCLLGQKLEVLVLSTLPSPSEVPVPTPTPLHQPSLPPPPLSISSYFKPSLCSY
ncbi:hypothetical protein GOP47_0001780 [Adiantum capillus-veneris]|uniref:Phytocyanin domain-containing protein n=1 Tax=Adiantum capillus-veneris TaxID=13818 RepID=A0A9D4V9G9_ADICA|nr:hypothetical protein GOP47_0001780 [Adiantum capillus-veneris]